MKFLPGKLHFPATAQKSFRASEEVDSMQSSPPPRLSERLQLSNCREVLTGRGKEGGTEEGNSFFSSLSPPAAAAAASGVGVDRHLESEN